MGGLIGLVIFFSGSVISIVVLINIYKDLPRNSKFRPLVIVFLYLILLFLIVVTLFVIANGDMLRYPVVSDAITRMQG